ncbi:hypothetical protein ACFQZ4_32750 [Catellatospora coxensis]|uniref:Lipoprotein n=1 Tax=Catellatospora coxensis TaxID=310354 RepID=A0A8J3KZK3_9ACTN|nr:hypothetical protein [Catellatospora coxensis]GIG06309.1 hypothetical protein Cco03nite_30090 [Catellatospora coxensis]
MRRLLVSAVLGAALLATTACGGNPTRPGAMPSPGAVVGSGSSAPGAAVPPSGSASAASGGPKSPVPGAAAGLSPADQAICTGRREVYQKVTTATQRYAGLVDGRYAGGDQAKRQVLAELQKALADYRDHLARRAASAVDQRLAGAMRADVSYVSKRLTDLRAAGTDYDGKVFLVVDTIVKGASKDQRVPALCGG